MKYLKSIFTLFIVAFTLTSCEEYDNIIGVWDVKNNYYQAVYEIFENDGKFIGKIHYYNDGEIEYKADDKKESYFLTDVEKKDGKYINGKMYPPDGSYYKVIFNAKDANTLEVLMTIEGQPYKEIWNRQSNYN